MITLSIRTGPMLRYDSVDLSNFTYHGYAMIVTEDAKSDYSSIPALKYSSQAGGDRTVQAIQLHRYSDKQASFTFWRFKLEIPLIDQPQTVSYFLLAQIHPESQSEAIRLSDLAFVVPGRHQNFRWAGHSCNGFSANVDESLFNGPNPLWDDMLREHQRLPFHVVIGGGDQIYCDKLVREPQMQGWHTQSDPKKRMAMPLTAEIDATINRYMFHHYCDWFGSGTFSRAIAQIPMINMLDDHDLIDGFGTYPDDLMMSPVFNHVGSRGYFYFLLFQLFVNDQIDGEDQVGHPQLSMVIGGPGTYIPFRNHSLLCYLGPKQWILLIDCRSERKLDQICSKDTYTHLFHCINQLPSQVQHLIILVGVPLSYPRMVFLEKTLSSNFNPFIKLAKTLSPTFTNNFNGQAELLDDLNDHWCSAPHKHERNWLIEKIQVLVLQNHVRISFLSGDVHASGVGVFHGYHHHKDDDPEKDPKYALAIITSAIVNTPPPPKVVSLLNRLASKKHRSLFYCGTKESMIALFEEGLDGKKQNEKYIMGARNWCSVNYMDSTDEIEFELRIEKQRGTGQIKSYPIRAPPPRWNPSSSSSYLFHHS